MKTTSGFGLIELLITLVLVMVLAITLLKQHQKKTSSTLDRVAAQMREDVESDSSRAEITQLSPQFLFIHKPNGFVTYELQGTFPNQNLVRKTEVNPGEVLINNVGLLRFTAYDKDNRFLPDEVNEALARSITKVTVEIGFHSGQEDPTFFVNDLYTGIDLDNNLSNGVARVTKKEFGLIINKFE